MRIWVLLIAAAIAVAGCSDGSAPRLSSAPPGLDVAQAALAGAAPEVALRVSSDNLRREPGNIRAMLLQGDALSALGRAREAEESYRRALAIAPDSAEARVGLARLLLASDAGAAERLLLEALSHDPRNAKALNDLGIARDLQGRHRDAQAAYRAALGIAPEMQAATVNLALSLALGGQASLGADLLKPLATAPGASPRIRHDFAAISEMAGNRAAAEEMLKPDLTPEQVQDTLRSYDTLSVPPRPGGRGP